MVEASYTAFFKMVTTAEDSSKTLSTEKEQQEENEANSKEEKHPKKEEPQQVYCADHEEEVQLFCIACEELLCLECVTSKHKAHDFCTLKSGGQKVKVIISKALDKAMAKSKVEVKYVDECIAKAWQIKDLLQNFKTDVTHEKNLLKNLQKKLNLKHEEITSRFPLFDEMTNLLETIQKDVPLSLIEELQEKAKNTSEELVGASEEENPILVIARDYMVTLVSYHLWNAF